MGVTTVKALREIQEIPWILTTHPVLDDGYISSYELMNNVNVSAVQYLVNLKLYNFESYN